MAAMQEPTDNKLSSSQSTAAAAPVRVWGLTPLAWWRGFAIFFLILLIFAAATGMSMFEQFKAQVAHLQKQLLVLPQIKYIAVLTDGQGAPELLVTMDPTENALVLQRVGSLKEGREDSLQLWALPASGPARSLGLLASGSKTLRIPATEKDLRDVSRLGVSAESKGGVIRRM
jgi:anti-sigma-K factor RskA